MEKLIKINNDFKDIININKTGIYNFIDIQKNSNDINVTFDIFKSVTINFSSLTWNKNKKIYIKINLNSDDCNVVLNVNSLTINNFNTEIILCGTNIKMVENNSIDMQVCGILSSKLSSIKCMPIYKFNTNKINALHGLTIGTFNEDEVFSILSKGINIKDTKTMLIWSKFNDTLKSLSEKEKKNYYNFILEKWGNNEQ